MSVSKIKILSEDLINKIAAGEVIERPASVVKELIENSIDAAATKITIEIQAAGRKLIRVSDNGHGMDKEEVLLSVERHSTSKISKLDDLFNIQSLGFRGEALPSIASVSRFEVLSRSKNNDAGTELKLEGGKDQSSAEAGCPQGTTVSIKDLFFNTPARKKFLKSPATEMGHIANIVAKYAMVNPQIAFELISDGKPLLSTPGSGNLKDAVISIYGLELTRELIAVAYESPLIKIKGLISPPTISRIDKTYENFFVNKRYVRNFLLNRALEDSYRALIPNNRYPAAILFIEIDPQQVDVNVHPTKREVKFVKTNDVMGAIRQAVGEALQGVVGLKNSLSQTGVRGETAQNWQPEMEQILFEPHHTLAPSRVEGPHVPQQEIEVSSSQPLIPLYQLKNTYIICTDGEELVLIDQHAAHERILYDQLSPKGNVTSRQALLLPETIEVNPKENSILSENLEYLSGIGFDLEEFGNNSYILRSVPAISAKAPAKQLLIDIISELQNLGKSVEMEVKQEKVKKLIACHSAIKAGDKLTQQEMNQLIKDLYATINPATCPHGRPTIIRIQEEELKKRFGR
ncbi:MAG: DNA mismatch repair endonuclease MutL [Candidatus Saganbacteria bacterium]|nr:DNA mismatch repair endonuclease MutL [Candidatus Saganbacteria bacterium]